MKKLLLLASLMAIFFISSFAESNINIDTEDTKVAEIKGFLTTKACADHGLFKDCRLETIVCGEIDCYKNWEFGQPYKTELVLFVHNDGIYNLHIDHDSGVHISHLIKEGINRNDVTIKGHIDGNNINVTGYDTPPPPKKSFFKGCL
jgi:hypothetical protein